MWNKILSNIAFVSTIKLSPYKLIIQYISSAYSLIVYPSCVLHSFYQVEYNYYFFYIYDFDHSRRVLNTRLAVTKYSCIPSVRAMPSARSYVYCVCGFVLMFMWVVNRIFVQVKFGQKNV